MKWSEEAEAAISRVPFFVRKKVRARVEKEAAEENKNIITLSEVKATQKRFLSGMSSRIKGYQVETCFGANGCPNRCIVSDSLLTRLEDLFKSEDILGFLKTKTSDSLKYHHEFRVTIAECPNACSQPQIRDVGIIAASVPGFSEEPCSLCNSCVEVCKENALTLTESDEIPELDIDACVYCGSCIKACPTGTIVNAKSGYRVLTGGRLGRHPQLARELPGLFSEDKVVEIVKYCIDFYKKHSKGERFSHLIDENAFNQISAHFKNSCI